MKIIVIILVVLLALPVVSCAVGGFTAGVMIASQIVPPAPQPDISKER